MIDDSLSGKYDGTENAVFHHLHGSRWHEGDARFVFFLDRLRSRWLVLAVVVAALGVAGCMFWKGWKAQLWVSQAVTLGAAGTAATTLSAGEGNP